MDNSMLALKTCLTWAVYHPGDMFGVGKSTVVQAKNTAGIHWSGLVYGPRSPMCTGKLTLQLTGICLTNKHILRSR